MKTTVGYSRRGAKKQKKKSAGEEIFFAVGLLALGVTLAGPIARGSRTPDFESREAVAVAQMSVGAVTDGGERDILEEPEKYAALEEDWSVFDAIGLFFANMIRGE